MGGGLIVDETDVDSRGRREMRDVGYKITDLVSLGVVVGVGGGGVGIAIAVGGFVGGGGGLVPGGN